MQFTSKYQMEQRAGFNRCEAYNYVSPGRQGPNARCWLKNQVPGSRSQSGLVSGVKVDARTPMKQNLNLPGQDYRNSPRTARWTERAPSRADAREGAAR